MSLLRDRPVTLHIGLHKTATSTVQAAMAGNYGELLEQGLCYPKALRTARGFRYHRPLARLKISTNEHQSLYQSVLDEAGGRNIFFSCEEIGAAIARFPENGVVDVLNKVHGPENVQLLISVRNIYDLVESLFSQFLRSTLYGIEPNLLAREEKLTPEGFLDEAERRFGFPLYSFLGYVNIIKKKYPLNDIRIVSIEKKDIHMPYLKYLGQALGVDFPKRQSTKNVRLTNASMMIFREARHFLSQKDFHAKRYELGLLAKRVELNKGYQIRNSNIQSSESLKDKIQNAIVKERSEFLALMDTPGDAVFERKPTSAAHPQDLSPKDKRRVRRIATGRVMGLF